MPLYGLYKEVMREAPEQTRATLPDLQEVSLEDLVLSRLRAYTKNLQGYDARNLYDLIMPQLERPLVRVAMELADGRQRRASAMLGIHRNTLRTRLRTLGLSPNTGKAIEGESGE